MLKHMHVANSARQAGAATNLVANNKATNYDPLQRQVPASLPGDRKCTINITGDPKETAYLFQQLSVAL